MRLSRFGGTMTYCDQNSESGSEFDRLEEAGQAQARRQQEAEAIQRARARLAAATAAEASFDPIEKAAAKEKRQYRPRQKRDGLGARLTAIQEHLLRALAFLNDLGVASVTVPELANRIGCSTRSIQYGLTYLVSIGYIERDIRPSANPRRHLPSVIRVLSPGWLRLGRLAPASFGTQKIALPSEYKNINSSTKAERSGADAPHASAPEAPNGAARIESNPENLEQTDRPKLPSGRQREAAKPSPHRPTVGARRPLDRPQKPAHADAITLARAAASRLHPSRAAIIERLDPYEVIDAVRRQHFSHFNDAAWSRAVLSHGRETALLAVALTLLRPIDGRGREIRSKASYLGGMLRQSPGALNPIASLSSLLH